MKMKISKLPNYPIAQLFNSRQRRAGFTLIEILIVVGIIGILIAVSGFYFKYSVKKARDEQRKAHIQEYKIALEAFANANNSYYPSSGTSARRVGGFTYTSGTVAGANSFCESYLKSFMTKCPEDPKYDGFSSGYYKYLSGGSSLGTAGTPTALKWVLQATLETDGANWVSCSNGKTGKVASGTVVFYASDARCPVP